MTLVNVPVLCALDVSAGYYNIKGILIIVPFIVVSVLPVCESVFVGQSESFSVV